MALSDLAKMDVNDLLSDPSMLDDMSNPFNPESFQFEDKTQRNSKKNEPEVDENTIHSKKPKAFNSDATLRIEEIPTPTMFTERKKGPTKNPYPCQELRDLERKYFRTNKKLELVSTKLQSYILEVKKAYKSNSTLRRELNSKRRVLERLNEEKSRMEKQAIVNRDYAKRLEQKLSTGAKGQAIADKQKELEEAVKRMKKEVKEKNEIIAVKEDEVNHEKKEVAVLQHALQVRFEELGVQGNVRTGLLVEIGRLKEKNGTLGVQIARDMDKMNSLQRLVREQEKDIDQLVNNQVSFEYKIGMLEKERVEQEKKKFQLSKDRDKLQKEKQMMLGYIKELAGKVFSAQESVKQEKAKHMDEINAVRKEILAVKEENSAMKDELQESNKREKHLEQIQNVTEGVVAHERSTNNALRAEIEKQNGIYDELRDQVKELSEELNRSAESSSRHLEEIHTVKADNSVLRATIEELRANAEVSDKQIAQQKKMEQNLQQELESCLNDLQQVTNQRNEATKAMNEAVSISAASMEEQHQLESRVIQHEADLEKLRQSKALLQKAMLDQLSAVRQQLEIERNARIELESSSRNRTCKKEPKRTEKDRGIKVDGFASEITPPGSIARREFSSAREPHEKENINRCEDRSKQVTFEEMNKVQRRKDRAASRMAYFQPKSDIKQGETSGPTLVELANDENSI